MFLVILCYPLGYVRHGFRDHGIRKQKLAYKPLQIQQSEFRWGRYPLKHCPGLKCKTIKRNCRPIYWRSSNNVKIRSSSYYSTYWCMYRSITNIYRDGTLRKRIFTRISSKKWKLFWSTESTFDKICKTISIGIVIFGKPKFCSQVGEIELKPVPFRLELGL